MAINSTLIVVGDTLVGSVENDTLFFGITGSTYITGEIQGLDGNDTITSQDGSIGSPGVQVAFGNQGDDSIDFQFTNDSGVPVQGWGGLGIDAILGAGPGGGPSTLVGGEGSDAILIVALNDQNNVIYGGTQPGANQANDAADLITSNSSGNDLITGNVGNDSINSLGGGKDTIYGGLNNDLITITGSGDDLLFGGEGSDAIDASLTTGNNVIYGGTQPGANQSNDAADSIFGGSSNTGSDIITGNLGNDTISDGGGKNHLIFGGKGDDNITVNSAGGGIDTLVGGEGKDTILAATASDNLIIYGGTQPGADQTDDGADSLVGGSGNDLITSNLGNDTVNGGAGNNTIFGGFGNDSLTGGTGNDIIYGNAGLDTLTGDLGNNVFRYSVPTEIAGPANVDILTDFLSTADKIQLATGDGTVFSGLNFTTGTTVSLSNLSLTSTAANIDSLFSEVVASGGVTALSGSTSTSLVAANIAVTGGTFGGQNFLFLNDSVAGGSNLDILIQTAPVVVNNIISDINFASFG